MPIINKEVALFNYLNFHVAYELDNLGTKSNTAVELIDKIQNKTSSNPKLSTYYEFINPGNVLALAYTSLVVPKELFSSKTDLDEFLKGLPFDLQKPFKDQLGSKQRDDTDFLRFLRNAVAHANYEFTNSRDGLTLWNSNRNGVINFKVSCTLSDFANVCLGVAQEMCRV